MNIAICDDDEIIRQMLADQVARAEIWKDYDCSVQQFSSGDELLAFVRNNPGCFQIYLLDIGMEGMDGLETARQIRSRDKDAVLLFVTSHGELMPEAFQVLAFGFLVKPVQEDVLAGLLLSAVHLLECRHTLYSYTVRKKIYSLQLARIEYIESLGRKVILHLTDGQKREYNGTLKAAIAKTEGLTFAQAHHSYVINLEQIKELESWLITMQSGDRIKITNTYHSEFHSHYRRFILMHADRRSHV